MKIQDITSLLENMAPPFLQEEYDNSRLITGNESWNCTGIIISLDVTEDVVKESIEKKCNLIIAHHPIIFKGLKSLTGKNYVEKTIITAIKNDIAIYAIHTNLDNIIEGVNGKIADKLGLENRSILVPKNNLLQKLALFVPIANKEEVLNALFTAGAGHVGNYEECSYITEGTGSFKAATGAQPYAGQIGKRHYENEVKVEVVYPLWLQTRVLKAMKAAHPYEEIAHDIYSLNNQFLQTGSGIIGELKVELLETEILKLLQNTFNIPVIKHTALIGKPIRKVAICGGSGSFLIGPAIASGAGIYISADIRYHDFFDANDRLVIADIGHYESEQFTIDLLFDILRENFPNFAVLKTAVKTNPVHYFSKDDRR